MQIQPYNHYSTISKGFVKNHAPSNNHGQFFPWGLTCIYVLVNSLLMKIVFVLPTFVHHRIIILKYFEPKLFPRFGRMLSYHKASRAQTWRPKLSSKCARRATAHSIWTSERGGITKIAQQVMQNNAEVCLSVAVLLRGLPMPMLRRRST